MSLSSQNDLVFVYGALRSGTTLLHLILGSHSDLETPGEGDFLFDYLSPDPSVPGGWRYDTHALKGDRIFRNVGVTLPADLQGADLAGAIVEQLAAKNPGQKLSINIHRNAHLMAALFPDTKVIHLLRDPRDVARSSVQMGWCGNSYHAVHLWVKTETTWDDANIPEAQVLTVRFEELMAALETQLTRMCDFLGLSFETGMLDYHTRSSYSPPDPNISQKWRQKASVHEIALIEGRAGHLMATRNYDLAGDPAKPGFFEASYLFMDNRLRRWRHNIRRYGLGLFLKQHAARVVGLTAVADRFAAEQEAIRVRNLK